MRLRRKTYAGDLTLALNNGNVIQDYEERIALLESHNSRISGELKAARDALVDEREDRRIERQSIVMSAPSGTSRDGQTGTDSHINEHSEILYERKLRMEILESLKRVRAQNMTISRSLRESQDNYASLSSVLEAEQREKEELREEIKRLSQKNFMLFEHNKLLVSRDSALQDEISSLMTKSQADDWMRAVLEEELQTARKSPIEQAHGLISAHVKRSGIPAPSITLEHQGPLRAQLVAARDELHVARRCLEKSEKKCEEMESRVSSLQREMSQCLDSSAQALDVERELRNEVEEYARKLEEENARLKDEIHHSRESTKDHVDADSTNVSVKSVVVTQPSSSKPAEFSEAHIPHKILCGDIQKITVDVRNVTLSPTVVNNTTDDMPATGTDAALKARRRERLLERQLRLSSSKRIARRRSSVRFSRSALFASVASPTITDVPVTMFQSVALTPTPSPPPFVAPMSVDSASNQKATQSPASDRVTRRDSLKPLQLGSPGMMSLNLKRLTTLRSSESFSRPTSMVASSPVLPPVPPSTPRKQGDSKRNHQFKDSTSSSKGYYPDSPYSTASTLVASSLASNVDLRKSLMINTTLSKKPSFDGALKTSTTLFLDMHTNDRERQLPTATTEKSMKNDIPSSGHMRRASALLATIAKSTGIGSLEDWFVV
jgi:hypothetical protein